MTHRCTQRGLDERDLIDERLIRLANEEIDQRAAEERRDAEMRTRSTYRPDETELFRDRIDDAYWEASHREYEER